MKRSISYIFWSLVLILGSCVYPIDLEPEEQIQLLSVDGILTDSAEPSIVKLRYTKPLSNSDPLPVSDAELVIENQDGLEINLLEIEPGDYYTPQGFRAKVGDDYQLLIRTADGKNYESDVQKLYASPAIDSIYDRFNEIPNSDVNQLVRGLEFLVDSRNTGSEAKYYRYTWDQTYEIRRPFPSWYDYTIIDEVLEYEMRPNTVGICFPNEQSKEIITATTEGTSSNSIIELPIHFITEKQQDLKVKYSILVKQHAINKSAYEFYRRLKESTESVGTLIDKQQGATIGNIVAVENPFEQVVGYFEVSGVSELRATFNRGDLDRDYVQVNNTSLCISGEQILTDGAIVFQRAATFNMNLRIVSVTQGMITYGPFECTDCTNHGTTEVPDFW